MRPTVLALARSTRWAVHVAAAVTALLARTPLAPTLQAQEPSVPEQAVQAPTAQAAERTLSWPRIDVTAHLDADGRLHVVERQVMRFTGDWNGGERRIATSSGQYVLFHGMTRVDSAPEAPAAQRIEMAEGAIDAVDGWQWRQGTVRWRSRLPTDPPFADTRLVYELAFSYDRILVAQDDGRYLLDHDFAFADRSGTIDTLDVVLTVDPAWRTPADFTGVWLATALAPGEGFGVDVPLVRVAATVPAGVRIGAPASTRWAVLACLVAGIGVLVAGLLRHDARLGRFAPGPRPEEVTPAWLERELFAHLPEVIGAAWDAQTSQAEVAATLARLVQERRLASRVEATKGFLGTSTELHLELLVDRATLRDHERRLVDGLFGTATTTSTSAIRARYKSTGFDPAGLIAPRLAELAGEAVTGTPRPTPRWFVRWGPAVVLVLVALVLAVLGARQGGDPDVQVFVAGFLASWPAAFVVGIAAAVWRRRAASVVAPGLWLAFGLLAPVAVFAVVLVMRGVGRPNAWTLAALATWWLAVTWFATAGARTNETAERLRWRKRLGAAREFFRAELARPEPRLDDAWYPYLLAFGLGKHVDRWFAAFGGEAARSATTVGGTMRSSGGSGSRSPSGGGFTGFGGGGGFSGGGGGADFGAALGAVASSVAAPSSSSSGGGSRSSGSSSSGGGGGGGW
jgi:uncharacterized membrane protein YgcG